MKLIQPCPHSVKEMDAGAGAAAAAAAAENWNTCPQRRHVPSKGPAVCRGTAGCIPAWQRGHDTSDDDMGLLGCVCVWICSAAEPASRETKGIA